MAAANQTVDLVSSIRRCNSLVEARTLHSLAVENYRKNQTFTANLVIEMYGRCGGIDEARRVFDAIANKNVFSWTIILTVYARSGHLDEAKFVFDTMPEKNVVSETTMIMAYAEAAKLDQAKIVFDSMQERNLFAWNALITGHARHGHYKGALKLLQLMDLDGVRADRITFLAIIESCSGLNDFRKARLMHSRAGASGYALETKVANALITMYGRFGALDDATKVFQELKDKSTVSWNAMAWAFGSNGRVDDSRRLLHVDCSKRDLSSYNCLISGFSLNDRPQEAVEVFEMLLLEGEFHPDDVSFLAVLSCSCFKRIRDLRTIYNVASEAGYLANTRVANSLVNCFGRSGALDDATCLFREITKTANAASCWNVLLGVYVESNLPREAILLFREMDVEGVKLDYITMILAVDACRIGGPGATLFRRSIHDRAIRTGFLQHVKVATGLVTMYGEYGMVGDAFQVFCSIPTKNLLAWTALVVAYARNGHMEQALEAFQRMGLDGCQPDEIAFVGIISACSHGGRVREGWHFMAEMYGEFGVGQKEEHYSCLVDMLGRAGLLDEAERFIQEVTVNVNPWKGRSLLLSWKSLLSSCRVQGDLELAHRVLTQVDR
ncbi:pentatricopeptide repeat-containing protein At4g33990 [Selaginella moellendorffii]|uniref:pentatricopeptide repeat-containing protein At4g33990 n=1 Tax=Selaginella moellendorffii TaxID=88036 RepID=UPI000D1C3038|nr:pentatricopeptide repeat-containing protein At4g33990 [Selaginella moellendorffii]|eukprot:XP_024523318.1 pentatricopeptide repeat-containing protein At4g33990 [Selaginella moellendorffii]